MNAGLLAALREVSGMGRRRVRDLYEWGEENPGAFSNYLLGWAHFCEHRHTVLKARRVLFRKAARLTRLQSLAEELREFADEVRP